jgi:hypothetical protein
MRSSVFLCFSVLSRLLRDLRSVCVCAFWFVSFVVSVVSIESAATPLLIERSFAVDGPSEVIATIHASCARCDWGVAGREGAAVEIAVDGRYQSHLMLTRGAGEADYSVLLGHYERGSHTVTIIQDRSKSARHAGTVRVTGIDVASIAERDASYEAVAHAPILHARPNTIGRFSDVPLLMWYETAATPRGRSYRYSVIFSNEDGGTATDRLMATWGRTTDIEFVYGVEIGAGGRILAEEFQGPEHVVAPFRGAHEAGHPLEFVVTDNNMVSDAGATAVRYAPAPELFDLTNRSREVVMDAHAWSYRVASQEMLREGKIAERAPAGSGRIPDPRRFVFVEACSDLENAGISFGIRAAGPGTERPRPYRGPQRGSRAGVAYRVAYRAEDLEVRGEVSTSVRAGAGSPTRQPRWGAGGGAPAPVQEWYESDRGREDFRIVRTGCFRGAVPLPRGAVADAIRFRAWPRRTTEGTPSVRITRVNSVFTLSEDFLPRPSRFNWTGSMVLKSDGTSVELPFSHQ